MSHTAVAASFSQESFESFLAARNEPAWLVELRRDAWNDFQSMAWPSSRDEEWMRTDIRTFKLDRYALPSPAPHSDSTASTPQVAGLLAEGVDLGGSSISSADEINASLDEKWSAQGVIFGSLDQIVQEHGELVRAVSADTSRQPESRPLCGLARCMLERRAVSVRSQGRCR